MLPAWTDFLVPSALRALSWSLSMTASLPHLPGRLHESQTQVSHTALHCAADTGRATTHSPLPLCIRVLTQSLPASICRAVNAPYPFVPCRPALAIVELQRSAACSLLPINGPRLPVPHFSFTCSSPPE
jgi:hypothetical protein